jgi:hypothetical protein
MNLPLLFIDDPHQRIQTFFDRLSSERLGAHPLRKCEKHDGGRNGRQCHARHLLR